jgi:hypothetical protein
MTEAEWLAGRDYEVMLRFLHYDRCALRGRTTDPKVRLIACFYCRQIWHVLTDERSRTAVEVAERHAIGEVSDQTLAVAADAAWQAAQIALQRKHAAYANPLHDPEPLRTAFTEAVAGMWGARAACLAAGRPTDRVAGIFRRHGRDRGVVRGLVGQALHGVYQAHGQATHKPGPLVPARHVIHEIFGNPFRPAPPIEPAWLAWKDSTVTQLARAGHDNRRLPAGTLDPARLAVLSDALEDAGCTDGDLLGHLRGPGPHVRGCWALDLVLAKE